MSWSIKIWSIDHSQRILIRWLQHVWTNLVGNFSLLGQDLMTVVTATSEFIKAACIVMILNTLIEWKETKRTVMISKNENILVYLTQYSKLTSFSENKILKYDKWRSWKFVENACPKSSSTYKKVNLFQQYLQCHKKIQKNKGIIVNWVFRRII